MRLIDADALDEAMYHEAFETDTDMQKWDSGCWIRYKMFENAIKNAPTIEERKTGKWVHGREIWREQIGDMLIGIGYEDWRCSECHTLAKDDASAVLWKYCPWCGARMEGAGE